MQAATVVINRRALRHNLQRLRELAPASKMVAVVKANAYGHGLLRPRERSPMLTLWRSPSRRSSATACGGNHQTCTVTRRLF
ncbi:alanine racemase [Escherichia coli]|uniref:Alanine racemase, biosynthetic n=1 Tax=Escherichia coli TaxID=562 RepID=A0A377CE95_ECOLX|nr:alanine racemase [Escherichia coli]